MKRKITVALLALVLLVSMCIPAFADLNLDARSSVVVVRTCLETDSGIISFGWGSGFFVNSSSLVTNYHVISDFVEFGAGDLVTIKLSGSQTATGRAKIYVYFDSNDREEAYPVEYTEAKDIAILRLDNPTKKRTALKLLVPTEKMVGSTIYAVGFPGLAENILADSTTSWGKTDASVTTGTISRLMTTSGSGQHNVQVDIDIKHGNSGGPVVTSDGAVIGVATWGFSNESGESVNYAINIDEAITLLKRNGVEYTLEEPPKPTTEPTTKPTTEPTTLPTEPGTNWVMIGGSAAAVVALVIAVVLLVTRKKKHAPMPPAPPVTPVPHVPPAPAPKTPTIRSLSQSNYGASAKVSSQPVLIGRNVACVLKFPDGTPGISGSHCTVSWDGQNFVVTDVNSTYGTFLATGQKMTPNVAYRLRPGEKIYLAEKANTVSLELE